jgi:hypothetical protein
MASQPAQPDDDQAPTAQAVGYYIHWIMPLSREHKAMWAHAIPPCCDLHYQIQGKGFCTIEQAKKWFLIFANGNWVEDYYISTNPEPDPLNFKSKLGVTCWQLTQLEVQQAREQADAMWQE